MYIEIDDLNIFYTGIGQGPSVVLLHGWGGNSKSWYPVEKILAENFYVINLDFPGFGQSDTPKSAWGVEDYAECIRKFLGKLDIEPAIIIGHSFGGRIAIVLSAKYPKMVTKLILVNSAGIRPPRGVKYWSGTLAAKIGKAIFSLPGLKNLKPAVRRFLYKAIGEHDYERAGRLKESFKKIINQDLTLLLPSIIVPTLIVWGKNDREMPLSTAVKMQKLIPNSQLEVIKDAGHFCFLEKPEEFCRIIKENSKSQTISKF